MRGKAALTFAFLIGCAAAAPAGALAQGADALDPNQAEQRLRAYVQVWESDERVAPRAMREYYADRVIYYGKRMTRREVLADKLRFIRAYPQRRYDIAPDSLRTDCDVDRCVARAVLMWRRARADGASQSGASMLTLVFSAAEGGRIVQESARTLRSGR
jgi:hypothetical protein